MAYRREQANFSKGVLTKELWGRSDIAPWNAAVRQGKNVLVLKYGGLTKRPGTRFVYEIKDGEQRLIPFEGAYEASYAMLLGQATMRLAAKGGMVLEEMLTVEGLTATNPVEITASFHGYEDGDEVFISDLGIPELDGGTYTVTVTGDDTFTIPVDGTGFPAFGGDDGDGIVRVEEPDPPPAPPAVPPPADPPDQPGTTWCVSADSFICMADGPEKPAKDVRVGDMVWTMHERTFRWGAFRVSAIQFVTEPVMRRAGWPDASPRHRFMLPEWLARWLPERLRWFRMRLIGRPAGEAVVAKITVEEAHTYVARHPDSPIWRLSHNAKDRDGGDFF